MAYASDMNAVQNALASDNLGRARVLLNRHRPESGEVDLRGWEWRYLWQFCRSDAQSVLKDDNESQILSIAASADGKWAAVGHSSNGQLSVHNLQTKEIIRVPAGNSRVRVAFSPRESLLAIARSPNRVLLWDVNTRQVVRELSVGGLCNGLSFSEDGQTLAIGSGSTATGAIGEVSVWRVTDGSKVAGWAAGLSAANTGSSWFAATRDASAAAVVTAINKLSVIDLKTGQERWSAVATDDQLRCFAFSPDGRVLATGAGYLDATIRLWDAATGQPLGRLEGQRGWTSGLAFLADGKHLVSGSADQTLRLWNLETHSVVRVFRGHKLEVHALALGRDQRTLLSGCKDGSAYLWDLIAKRGASSSGMIATRRGNWVFADGDNAIVNADINGHVVRRHGQMFQEETPLFELGELWSAMRTGNVRIVMSSKHPLLAVVTAADKLQVWDWERRALVREWGAASGTNRVIPVGFSADGAQLVVASFRADGASLRVWDLATGRETRSIDFPGGLQNFGTPILSADGTQFMALRGGTEDSVRFDLTSGRVTTHKLNLVQTTSGSKFSPDGRLLVVSSAMGYVRLFDTATYRETAMLSGFMFGAQGIGYSPDLQRLAIGSTAFEALTLWDVHSNERLLSLAAPVGALPQLAFSPDGNIVAGQSGIGATAGTLHFWRAPSWAEIEKAEAAEPSGQR